MKKLLFLIVIFYVLKANAQPYLITFAGTGASTTVISVKIENLTKGTSLTLNGDDILRLTTSAGVNSIKNRQSSELKIYPNPMIDNSTIEVFPPLAGDAIITVYDMSGKIVAQKQSYLDYYLQEFRLSGLNSGFHLISVKGNTFQYSGKLLCNGKVGGIIGIEKISSNLAAIEKSVKTDFKGPQATVDMVYTSGDRLKLTGISGIYSTVKIDIPAADKTILFNFIACTDGDNNNYPVVEIDSRVWMAENLKTTKYNDGINIPLVTDGTAWSNQLTPAYCWYNNEEAGYKAVYGALYKWYTVNTGKLCPAGWHVPADDELTALTTYLGGESVAGGKMKETGFTHWQTFTTVVTNESGFTALPGGHRLDDGTFHFILTECYLWSSTQVWSGSSWYRNLHYNSGNAGRVNYDEKAGFSVRCLRN